MTVLSKTTLEAEGIVASADETLCDGCGICVPICEYKAMEIVADKKDPKKKIVDINVGLCKGCGACVGACPSGALTQKGFKDDQIYAMIDAALEDAQEAGGEAMSTEAHGQSNGHAQETVSSRRYSCSAATGAPTRARTWRASAGCRCRRTSG